MVSVFSKMSFISSSPCLLDDFDRKPAGGLRARMVVFISALRGFFVLGGGAITRNSSGVVCSNTGSCPAGKQLRIMVQFLVALHLLRVRSVKSSRVRPQTKTCRDDVIVAQHTVQRQVFCNAVVITDDAGAIRQGYTASMVPPTTACSASRVCSMSASRGTCRVQRSALSSASSLSEVFSAHFPHNGQQHDTCRRCKRHDHNSQQRETISCLRGGSAPYTA